MPISGVLGSLNLRKARAFPCARRHSWRSTKRIVTRLAGFRSLAFGNAPGQLPLYFFSPYPVDTARKGGCKPPPQTSGTAHSGFTYRLISTVQKFSCKFRVAGTVPRDGVKACLEIVDVFPYHPLTRMGRSVDLPFAVLLILRRVADCPAAGH
jgi:hypothetical protein